ncbi:MAG: TonB-dependent receptor [Bacteroidia bacterium]
MKTTGLFIIFYFLSVNILLSQSGSIKGTVIDEQTGETLPGAVVMIEGTTIGANTDFDGVFTINKVSPGAYTIECKLISYNTKKLMNVVVKDNEPTILSLTLSSASTELGIVEIVTTMSKETTNAMLVMQKNNASVSDGISSESIKRTPDRNTSDVLKRISGASIQENKFAIIRGLNDRYNAAYINGAPLPSSESDRKAFAFDIFPSNMLDNLVIIKTATPDMPGEFAGGIIQVNTKSIPDKNEQTFSISSSYNTITTFKDFKTYDGGKYDWLGVDDGARALPTTLTTTADYSKLTLQQKGDYAKQINPSWAITNTKALPALNIQYSLANKGNIFGKNAGSIFAITYQNTNNYSEIIRREYEEQSTQVVKRMELNDNQYTKAILASAMWNLAYKLNDNHQINFKNLFSINSDDKVTIRNGAREFDQPEKQWEKSSLRWFTQNILYTGQLSGEHLLPESKIKLKWIGGYSDIKRNVPNMRRIVYQKVAATESDTSTAYAAVVQNEGTIPNAAGNMFFSETNEKISSFRYEASYPFAIKNIKSELKAGGFHQYRDRSFEARSLGFSKYRQGSAIKFNSDLLLLPEEEIFANENMGQLSIPGPYNGGFKLDEATKTSDSYTAASMLNAGFAMFDMKFFERLRAIYGVRIESYNQKLHTIKEGSNTPILVDTTVTDLLPSINLVYSINEKINIRTSYYRTVSRPEFRELAPFIFYDFVTDFAISGNPNLKRAVIDNYDLRFEFYPGAGQLISASGFYKNFTNAIEQANRPDVTRELYYVNVPKATNIGLELEYRLKLSTLIGNDSSTFLSSTTLYTNFAYIKSKVDVSQINGAVANERPLQGQSPIIINAGAQYMNPNNGWGISASYNLVGRRIYIVGSINEPDYWEKSRNIVDLQIVKRIKENFELKLNIRDVLAQNLVFYQDIDKNNKYNETIDNTMTNSSFGQTISFGVSYKF